MSDSAVCFKVVGTSSREDAGIVTSHPMKEPPLIERILQVALWAGVVATSLAGLHIVWCTLHAVVEWAQPLPSWDEWKVVEDVRAFERGDYGAEWLFRQHNEHRIAVLRLVFLIDYFWFQGRGNFSRVVSVVLQVVTGIGLLRMVRRALPRVVVVAFVGTFFAAGFAATQLVNFLWAFQVQFFMVSAATVWSIALIASVPTHRGSHAATRLLAGLFLAVMATCSMGNGLLLFPMAVFVLWVARARWTWLVLTSVLGLGVCAWYLVGWQAGVPFEMATATKLLRMPRYALAFLGSPFWGLGEGRLSWVAGLGVLGFLGVALCWWRTGQLHARVYASCSKRALLGVGSFLLCSALVVGFARSPYPVAEVIASRYSTPALLFWLVCCGAWALFCAGHSAPGEFLGSRSRRTGRRALAVVPAVLLTLFLWNNQWRGEARFLDFSSRSHVVQSALLAEVDDPAALRAAYPDPSVVPDRAAWLRAHSMSMFATGEHLLLGRSLTDALSTVPSAEAVAAGAVEQVSVVGAGGGRGLRIEGWVVPLDRGAPRWLLVADGQNRVVGIGRVGYLRFDLPQHATRGSDRTAFICHAKPGPQERKLSLHVVDTDWSRAWLVGTEIVLPPGW